MDRPDEALTLESEVLAGREAQAKRLGAETGASLDLEPRTEMLPTSYVIWGGVEEPVEHYVRALKLDRERAGAAPTVDIALDLNNIGEGLRETGNIPGAKAALDEGLGVTEKLGDSALRIQATLLHNLAVLLVGGGDLGNAELKLRTAVDIRTRVLPADHLDLAASRGGLRSAFPRRPARSGRASTLGAQHLGGAGYRQCDRLLGGERRSGKALCWAWWRTSSLCSPGAQTARAWCWPPALKMMPSMRFRSPK